MLTLMSFFVISLFQNAKADIQYTPPQEIQVFINRYNQAPALQQTEAVQNFNWSCTLVGAQSHMQRQNFPDFFIFKPTDGHLENSGSHFIRSFSVQNGELRGENEEILETVRYSSASNELLTILRSKQQPTDVLAIGACIKTVHVLHKPVLL